MMFFRSSSRISALFVLISALLYQFYLKNWFSIAFSSGRVLESIDNFPYKCRTLEHSQLEACGDMWLDEKGRTLYAACAGLNSRTAWSPSLSRFNASGRRAGGSALMAIYIDEPRKDGLFKMHKIRPTGYGSGPKDGILDLDRFDVQEVDSSTTRFWFLNQRPIYNAEGKIEKRKIGANTTIDVYEHRKRDKEMRYIGSSWSPKLHSPNSIAFMGANNFVVSNDRSGQTGLRRKLDPLLGGGSLVYYDDWSDRYTTTPKTLPIAGSIVRGHDDQVYVPSLVNDKVGVFQLQDDGTFRQARQIAVGLPVAGLSVDSRDDIWAVGRNKYDPTGLESQHSIIRIRQTEYRSLRYITEKILEDGDGISLKATSVARHDVKTKRIFIAGHFASGITVCEPQP